MERGTHSHDVKAKVVNYSGNFFFIDADGNIKSTKDRIAWPVLYIVFSVFNYVVASSATYLANGVLPHSATAVFYLAMYLFGPQLLITVIVSVARGLANKRTQSGE